jgi:hypothetical protein
MPYATHEKYLESHRKTMEKARLKKLADLDAFVERIKDCEQCRNNPHVLITKNKIPVCLFHWQVLADSDLEW